MNWIWIILLLCCCSGNNRRDGECGFGNQCGNSCIQPRREREYPRPPFAPECDRDCGREYDMDCDRDRDCDCDREYDMDCDRGYNRDYGRERDCGCRASEMEKNDCEA